MTELCREGERGSRLAHASARLAHTRVAGTSADRGTASTAGWSGRVAEHDLGVEHQRLERARRARCTSSRRVASASPMADDGLADGGERGVARRRPCGESSKPTIATSPRHAAGRSRSPPAPRRRPSGRWPRTRRRGRGSAASRSSIACLPAGDGPVAVHGAVAAQSAAPTSSARKPSYRSIAAVMSSGPVIVAEARAPALDQQPTAERAPADVVGVDVGQSPSVGGERAAREDHGDARLLQPPRAAGRRRAGTPGSTPSRCPPRANRSKRSRSAALAERC